jgi:hypothetical protein
MDPQREAQLREEARRTIEERERQRIDAEALRREQEQAHEQERLRQRIVEEETREFYRNSPDHFEYINEHGESEWLTRKQILAREGYFDYEEHVEDPVAGRRRVWLGLALTALAILAGLLVLWRYISEESAAVIVVSNLPGSAIWIDGRDSGEVSDARIELSPGEHLIEVRRPGWRTAGGGYQALRLEPGDEIHLLFELTPDP